MERTAEMELRKESLLSLSFPVKSYSGRKKTKNISRITAGLPGLR